MDKCQCGKPVVMKHSDDGYEYVTCPDKHRGESGRYEGGCKFRERLPVPLGKGFRFGSHTGQSYEEVFKKNRKYFVWCKNNVKPTKENADLFQFIKTHRI